ncbi:hypothetical protein B296_00042701 [Ensete ventricosum]|uniref:Uncharacterized protein n=1 Tax=Ensete ventricosum TaxID=4639 RepID=A0A426XGU8_ENSVE|nr:hypothetical protein B296_00042701 [Ensete ventricosum]
MGPRADDSSDAPCTPSYRFEQCTKDMHRIIRARCRSRVDSSHSLNELLTRGMQELTCDEEDDNDECEEERSTTTLDGYPHLIVFGGAHMMDSAS